MSSLAVPSEDVSRRDSRDSSVQVDLTEFSPHHSSRSDIGNQAQVPEKDFQIQGKHISKNAHLMKDVNEWDHGWHFFTLLFLKNK